VFLLDDNRIRVISGRRGIIDGGIRRFTQYDPHREKEQHAHYETQQNTLHKKTSLFYMLVNNPLHNKRAPLPYGAKMGGIKRFKGTWKPS
jgi:hypothetical protein